jgi:glucokinase
MISGQALARRAPQSMAAADVFSAAAGEPGLDLLVSEFVTELAFHVVNLAICVNPARIAVGGGLVQSWERLRPGLEQALKAGTPFPPELVTARFPADAPLIGAVALAADAAGAEFSLDTIPSQLNNAPHAENARTDSVRADGAIDGAPVIQPSHSLTERLQS